MKTVSLSHRLRDTFKTNCICEHPKTKVSMPERQTQGQGEEEKDVFLCESVKSYRKMLI